MISIIIRTKNEERWIRHCLKAVKKQTIKDKEVILVDNNSTDNTVKKALKVMPNLTITKIDKYKPGDAINKGIKNSKGEFITCLSAHCVPTKNNWLENLLKNFDDPQVAGVYGRQIPTNSSRPEDKRDLLITFGLDKRIHKKDSFFHNANSMIRKDIWEKHPFDENVTNIEDRVWGKKVTEEGYILVYEPEAAVYHHHGIHQSNNKKRCKGVVKILDSLDLIPEEVENNPLNPENLEIAAIIPLRENSNNNNIDTIEKLVLKTIQTAKESKYINRIIISTDCDKIASKAEKWGVEAPFLRPKELSSKKVRADEVLKYSLEHLENQGYFPDLIVPLEITHPFRPKDFLDNSIQRILSEGMDTIIAGIPEHRPCWIKNDNKLERLSNFKKTRDKRKTVLIGLPSLGCVTYPDSIRKGTRLGKKVGLYEIDDPTASIEIRSIEDFEKISHML